MSWHKHKWQKWDVQFNPPIPIDERHFDRDSSRYQRQAFGFTNITWKCTKCPDVKITTVCGKMEL